MEFDLDRLRANVRKATTLDLFDRVTVYRAGLEPEAVPVILEELRSRGVTAEAIVQHEEAQGGVLFNADGVACRCDRCHRPAVVEEWGWHRLFGKLPIFPRTFHLCEDHRTPVPDDAGRPPAAG